MTTTTAIKMTIDRFFEKHSADKAYELSRKLVDWLPEKNWSDKCVGYTYISSHLIDIDYMWYLEEVELMESLSDKYDYKMRLAESTGKVCY